MEQINFLVKTSRPRFWIYLLGPYVVGLGFSGINLSQINPIIILNLFFFSFPANLFLYGVNDLYDTDTDKLNPKKITHENLLLKSQRRILIYSIILVFIFTLILSLLQNNLTGSYILYLFLLLSYFYSAPPLRFKAKAFFDFMSNILYILPGSIAYITITDQIPNIYFIIAASFWVFAMHLLSAIPDINADKKAGIITSAVFLGEKKSLLLTSFFWSIFVIIILSIAQNVLALILLIYPLIPLIILIKGYKTISVYWFYPYINFMVGFSLFVYSLI